MFQQIVESLPRARKSLEEMTTFFNTMFVQPHPPNYPHAPRTLPPVSTLEKSISCTHLGDSLMSTTASADHDEPVSPWSLGSLLFASPFQTLFGLKKDNNEHDQRARDTQASPGSRPRGSIESLRSSLDRPIRPTPRPASSSHRSHTSQSPHEKTYIDSLCYSNARSRGNFKPQKTTKGTSSWQLRQFAEATLGSGSLRKAVKLPEGEDLNEWLAVNSTSCCQCSMAWQKRANQIPLQSSTSTIRST